MNSEDIQEFERLASYVRQYQALASKYNINDIFQDNGGKYLELMLRLGLKVTGRREGNDAIDEDGNEYELKTVNIDLTRSFSTHHHMNPAIIEKYRQVDWFFAVYQGIELRAIYRMTPLDLEFYYNRWEIKWNETKKDINNPKIPLKYIMENGSTVWLPEGVSSFNLPVRPKGFQGKQPVQDDIEATLFTEDIEK